MIAQLVLWIDYFRELDTTPPFCCINRYPLWIDYFRELDTTLLSSSSMRACCGLITLGN